MREKKMLCKLLMLVMVFLFILTGRTMQVSANSGADDPNPDTVVIYYVQDYMKDKISVEEGLLTSYQISTGSLSGTPEFSITSGSFYFSLSSDGKITPAKRNARQLIVYGGDYDNFMLNEDMDSPKYFISGQGTVDVDCGEYHKTIRVIIKDYAVYYADRFVAETAKEVTKNCSTQREKLEAITKWVADNTIYDVAYSRLHNMVVMGEGDCIANSITVVSMCRAVGITARLRRSNQDSEYIGNGHVNAFVKCDDGKLYVVDMFSVKTKPRKYTIIETEAYSTKEANGEITIFQYDGFDSEITIPDQLLGKPVTTLGIVDRLDPNGTAIVPIFQYRYDYNKYVRKVNIPASVTLIKAGALSGSDSLKEINVAEGNPNYSSSDGALYNKDKTELLYVPGSRTSLRIPFEITKISSAAFSDVESIDLYFEGSEDQWNKKNIALPEGVQVYFGVTHVEGLLLNKGEISFSSPNTTANLEEMNLVSVFPDDAVNKKIKFSVNDDSVVAVVNNVLYVNGEGECTITATSLDGGFQQEINVKVAYSGKRLSIKNGTITSVKIDGQTTNEYNGQSSALLKPGTAITVTRNNPENGRKFTNWTGSADNLFLPGGTTVDDFWYTYGNRDSISFLMPDENLSLTAHYETDLEIQRIEEIVVPDSDLMYNKQLYICENTSVQLSLKTYPEDAYTGDVTWESDNEGSLTVNNKGLVTTALPGYAKITVKAKNGSKNILNVVINGHSTDESTRKIIQKGDCLSQPLITEEYCVNCKKYVRIMIPADHDYVVSKYQKVSCTEDGILEEKCTKCGDIYKLVDKATGHKYISKITRYATDDQKGEITYTCEKCGDTYTEETDERDPNASSTNGGGTNGGGTNGGGTINNGTDDDTPGKGQDKPVKPTTDKQNASSDGNTTNSGTNPSTNPSTNTNTNTSTNPSNNKSTNTNNNISNDKNNTNNKNNTTNTNNDKTNNSKTTTKSKTSKKLTNKDLKKNLKVVDKKSKANYKITKVVKKSGKVKSGTVQYVSPTKKNVKKVVIPKTIKIAGVTFKVTTIGKNAFKGCKKLKSITINTLALNKIGANAFKDIKSNAKITMPKKISKKTLKKYKKMIKKAKAPKKVKYSK